MLLRKPLVVFGPIFLVSPMALWSWLGYVEVSFWRSIILRVAYFALYLPLCTRRLHRTEGHYSIGLCYLPSVVFWAIGYSPPLVSFSFFLFYWFYPVLFVGVFQAVVYSHRIFSLDR